MKMNNFTLIILILLLILIGKIFIQPRLSARNAAFIIERGGEARIVKENEEIIDKASGEIIEKASVEIIEKANGEMIERENEIIEKQIKKNPINLEEHKKKLYNNVLRNYSEIFPDNQNRNAAGFRFFKYFYEKENMNHDLFKIYNEFYCAVSGSVVSPRPNNYNIVKIRDLDGTTHFGKYYRCCVPCLSDIMRYTRIVETKINFGDKEKVYKLITIDDPCKSNKNLPKGIDSRVLNCKNNFSQNALRVDENGKITNENKGRMIIGVLHDLDDDGYKKYEKTLNILNQKINNKKRICTEPNNLQWGMGDIFVKLATLNQQDEYNKNIDKSISQEFCKKIKAESKEQFTQNNYIDKIYLEENGDSLIKNLIGSTDNLINRMYSYCLNMRSDRAMTISKIDVYDYNGNNPRKFYVSSCCTNCYCLVLNKEFYYKEKDGIFYLFRRNYTTKDEITQILVEKLPEGNILTELTEKFVKQNLCNM